MGDSASGLRVLHVISGLETGGAERALARTVRGLKERGVLSAVISVRGGGPVANELRSAGIEVHELGVSGPLNSVPGIRAARRAAAKFRPDVMQGWMYHGNLFAWLAAPDDVPIVFGVRHSLPRMTDEKLLTRWVVRIGALLSRRVAAVVYNAQCSREHHEAIGYAAAGAMWIPNGFDTQLYRPDRIARDAFRGSLGFRVADFVIGIVGRYHPIKGHRLFLAAAQRALQERPDLRFVVAGRGVTGAQAGLQAEATRLGVADKVTFLEEQRNVTGLMNAFDVLCLASHAEAFPNVVAEAMACGTPVIATNVGDVAEIVGDIGKVVPPGRAEALAQAMVEYAALSSDARRVLGERARERVVRKFSEEQMFSAFADLYCRIRPRGRTA